MIYKKGTKFKVCSLDELIRKGWVVYFFHYKHENYKGWHLSEYIIDEIKGKTLTVDYIDPIFSTQRKWYHVDENQWIWPVGTFLETVDDDHTCEEGMTPINGWFICKTCGANLKEIK